MTKEKIINDLHKVIGTAYVNELQEGSDLYALVNYIFETAKAEREAVLNEIQRWAKARQPIYKEDLLSKLISLKQ